MKKDDTAVSRYMTELKGNLRLKDGEGKEELIRKLERKVAKVDSGRNDLSRLKRTIGEPSELAKQLSDRRNWLLTMGTPLRPGIPLRSFLSTRGRMLLFALFLGLLLVSVLLAVFLDRKDMSYPILLALFVVLWGMMAQVLNNFLGYVTTYRELERSGMKIEVTTRRGYRNQAIIVYLCLTILDMGLIFLPILFVARGFPFSLTLGITTFLGLCAMLILILCESKVLGR